MKSSTISAFQTALPPSTFIHFIHCHRHSVDFHAQQRHSSCSPRRRPNRFSNLRCAVSASSDTPSISHFVLGLNQYSHDASIAVVASTVHSSDTSLDGTPSLVFALSKERLTRRKHDAGQVSQIVQHAIETLSHQYKLTETDTLNKVTLVVANNHHFAIAPFEKRLPFHVHARYSPPSYLSPWNLIGATVPNTPFPVKRLAPNARKVELSHHLAHAFSAVHDAPFDHGLVVVMDGMGDALDEWLLRASNQNCNSNNDRSSNSLHSISQDQYFSEISIPHVICEDHPQFIQFPPDVLSSPAVSFREAESAYIFQRHADYPSVIRLKRIFKRWTPQNAPSELPNHSFEEMDSVGALYSRASSILFNDWNVCGKVMFKNLNCSTIHFEISSLDHISL